METAVAAKDLFETLSADGSFRLFTRAVRGADLIQVLEGAAKLTVFAPIDAAFEIIPRDVKEKLFSSARDMTEVVTYHIVAGELPVSVLMGLTSARTLQGEKISLYGCEGVLVNDGKIIEGDIAANNGIIHRITTLLLPRRLARWWK